MTLSQLPKGRKRSLYNHTGKVDKSGRREGWKKRKMHATSLSPGDGYTDRIIELEKKRTGGS